MRVDRDEDPTVVEGLFRTVDWPTLPREGEGIGLGNDCPVTVESVGYDFNAAPTSAWVASCSTTSRRPNCASWGGAKVRFRSVGAERSPRRLTARWRRGPAPVRRDGAASFTTDATARFGGPSTLWPMTTPP
jgi:hypothetical protein